MSTLWTPSGEQPIRPRSEPAPAAPGPPPGSGRGSGAASGYSAGGPDDGDDLTEDQVRAELAAISEKLLTTPASVVVANHCIGLFQLAALHLDQEPPDLGEAQVAIDALGAVVEGLGARLGEDETPLRDALHQLRAAFVGATRAAGPSRS